MDVDIVLLKCSTSYPLPYEEVNLNTMVDFKEKFDVIVGLSDHYWYRYSFSCSKYGGKCY